MKEAIKASPYELVTNTNGVKTQFDTYHKKLVSTSQYEFEAMIPEIITPNFVSLYGNTMQGIAVREITSYVESLIPMIDVPDQCEYIEKGRVVKRDVVDPKTGKISFHKEKAFRLSKEAYKTIRKIVDMNFAPLSMYWEARGFVEKNLSTVDEQMFDRMNDYLWRNIMAVVYPEDVKREFKHLCINVKRKLYYLGDRDKVHNQILFGLYDLGDIKSGGTGKTTLLEAFSHSFSNGNPAVVTSLESAFKFNMKDADKYGIMFVDEDPRGDRSIKDKVKQFVDSSTRKVEGKGIEAKDVNNLLTIVIAANHKISSRLYEDEARGQRRDSTFEVIGNVIQYTKADMVKWFDKMFAVCPFDDDSRTYHHRNPHSDELTDDEFTVLAKISKMASNKQCYKLGQLAEIVEVKVKTPQWYALRSLLKLNKYFDVRVDHDKSKFYEPRMDEISKKIGCKTFGVECQWWSRDWRDEQDYIDVDAVIEKLGSSTDYDTTSPIEYSKYSAQQSDFEFNEVA